MAGCDPIIHDPGCGWETGPYCTCGADPERAEKAVMVLSQKVDEILPELFDELARYHGCDRHEGNPCKADQIRARRMLHVFRGWLIENEPEEDNGD
jgi:hypothetical protein